MSIINKGISCWYPRLSWRTCVSKRWRRGKKSSMDTHRLTKYSEWKSFFKNAKLAKNLLWAPRGKFQGELYWLQGRAAQVLEKDLDPKIIIFPKFINLRKFQESPRGQLIHVWPLIANLHQCLWDKLLINTINKFMSSNWGMCKSITTQGTLQQRWGLKPLIVHKMRLKFCKHREI
jgi:hypothetical protein